MGSLAPNTPCVPCNAMGHFCEAYAIDGGEAVCVSCMDGVLCRRVKARPSTPPLSITPGQRAPEKVSVKRDDNLPTADEATRAIAVHESLEPTPTCARCKKPKHRGGCAGIPRAKRTKIAPESETKTPRAETKKPTVETRTQPPDPEVIPIDDIPGRKGLSMHDEAIEKVISLPEGMARRFACKSAKDATRYATRLQTAIKRRKGIRTCFRINGNDAYVWKRDRT